MTKPVTIYGIKACDTMKKARGWLDAHKVAYEFHDYKAVGIDRARLQGWVGQVGWESLLNRSGTTFRKRARLRQAEPKRGQGRGADDRATVNDQAARPRYRRHARRRVQAGALRGFVRTLEA